MHIDPSSADYLVSSRPSGLDKHPSTTKSCLFAGETDCARNHVTFFMEYLNQPFTHLYGSAQRPVLFWRTSIHRWVLCPSDVFAVNKGPGSSRRVALGQVCSSAAGFLLLRLVSGCQTQYTSCQLLKVGTLISCDSVFLSFKHKPQDRVGSGWCLTLRGLMQETRQKWFDGFVHQHSVNKWQHPHEAMLIMEN